MSELRMLVAEAEEHNLRTLGLAVSDLRGLFSQIDHLTTELAASRAREAKMREALEYCVESTFSHWTIAREVARAALSASEDA